MINDNELEKLAVAAAGFCIIILIAAIAVALCIGLYSSFVTPVS